MAQAKLSMNTTDDRERDLLWIGAVAAFIMVVLTVGQFVSFAVAPPPLEGTAADWFALFQRSWLLGLLAFEALLVIYTVLAIPVSLALFVALRRSGAGLMALFVALTVVGAIAFVMARPGLEMLALSGKYAAASTDTQRAAFLAAGEAMVALFHGTAFEVGYLLGSIEGLILAAVMLRSSVFSRATAYLRLASSVFDFTIFVPGVGLYLSLLSVVFLLIFNILVARRLLQLARFEQKTAAVTKMATTS